jgi:hypothetical protein
MPPPAARRDEHIVMLIRDVGGAAAVVVFPMPSISAAAARDLEEELVDEELEDGERTPHAVAMPPGRAPTPSRT